MSATWEIREGDCVERMRELDDCSIDAVVTDPPYGIGFMGHEWDQPRPEHAPISAGHGGCNVSFGGPPHPAMEAGRYDLSTTANRRFQAWCEAWASEALRVLKPGGHMLVFGGTRTYHRMAAGVEDAGFEIRDQLAWLFGSGFPKSRNLDNGKPPQRGTALKPAHEPIVLARKPLVGTMVANVGEHRTGPLNIAACAIGIADSDAAARWPANVVLDEEAAAALDGQSGVKKASSAGPRAFVKRASGSDRAGNTGAALGAESRPAGAIAGIDRGDGGGASRFFYCAKTSRAEREHGLEHFAKAPLNWSAGDQSPGTFQSEGTDRNVANHHPTVKPIALMAWLVRLVTPVGGLVLDPFTGSGTTGIACLREHRSFLGFEREHDYAKIARARIRGDQPLFNTACEVAA